MIVAVCDPIVDGCLELGHAVESAASNALSGYLGKQPLNEDCRRNFHGASCLARALKVMSYWGVRKSALISPHPAERMKSFFGPTCRFRRKPATYSDLIAATLPI